ncbi:DUF6531 domain-containing protein [Ralstonia solanacearum]|uniref:DUF6531 domain-containing protein n=1 Tax=Ralstonia solanacearum TaxID=305 RepID=UPI001FFA5863
MADQDPGTPSPAEPTGSAEERLAALQTLENGEATKQSRMKWVDGANYGMLGADLGYGAYAASSAALGAGATGAAAAGAAALAAVPAVVALGGAWVLGKIGVTSKLEEGFEWVGDQLGLAIGRGDPHPACVGDDIAHSSGFWGMVAGLAVGVAIGAMVAATVATGGLAGAVLVGACMAGGLSLGGALASASQSMGSNCGKISTGSGNVTFEGKAAARVTDLVACTKRPGPEPLVEGSKTITVNGLPIVRIGHSTHCSGKVNSGRKSIWIDKTTGQYGPKNPELTAGEEFLAGLLGGLVGARIGGMVGKGRREPTESAERQGAKDETTTPCKDPIDVATGEMVDVRDDLSIPGVLPLTLTRRYRTRSDDDGLLGPKWSVNWSRHLRLDDGRLVRFNDGGGLTITFEAPDAVLNGINLREPRYRLDGTRAEPRILDDETRQVLVFAPLADGAVSRLERIEDHSGNAIAFDYDEHGRLIALRHTSGYRLALAYLGGARTVAGITLHEASGSTCPLVDYAYDGPMLARVSSFQHGAFHYTYDHRGWITGWRDTDQTEVRYRYDDAGCVVETGTRQGYHTGHLVYEDGRTRVLDADGEWIYEHNAEGLVTREIDPLGNSTQREWRLGRLVSETDPLGRRTDFSHDALGKLTGVREPSGALTQFQYDSQRRLAGVTLPTGDRVALEYDKQHRLIARTEPDGTIKRYRYGEHGEVLRVVDGERETRLDYDDQLRLAATRLPSGAKLGTRFDALGRLLEETDPDGNATRYDHTPGLQNPRGNVAQTTLADGTVHRTACNSEGLPIERTDPLGRTTRTTYGPFDLVTATIDAAGHATRFEYDHATRPTRIVNALDETWEYRYDAAGRLASETDWGGRTTHYARDAAGHLIAATVHGDTTHVTRFRYDGNGRLIEEDQHGHLLRHLYDALGQRTQRNTPHRATRYGYDALGALTQVGALTIQRDGLGRETGRQAGDFIAQRRYDAVGRLLRQAAGPRAAFDALQTDPVQALQQLTRQNYRYAAAGQLAQVETDADRFTYQHDARGQVTAVGSMRQPAEHYTYNATQNIAAHGRQGQIDARHYLPGGLPERVGHARYRYDARGRTIEKTVESGCPLSGLRLRRVGRHTDRRPDGRRRRSRFQRLHERLGLGAAQMPQSADERHIEVIVLQRRLRVVVRIHGGRQPHGLRECRLADQLDLIVFGQVDDGRQRLLERADVVLAVRLDGVEALGEVPGDVVRAGFLEPLDDIGRIAAHLGVVLLECRFALAVDEMHGLLVEGLGAGEPFVQVRDFRLQRLHRDGRVIDKQTGHVEEQLARIGLDLDDVGGDLGGRVADVVQAVDGPQAGLAQRAEQDALGIGVAQFLAEFAPDGLPDRLVLLAGAVALDDELAALAVGGDQLQARILRVHHHHGRAAGVDGMLHRLFQQGAVRLGPLILGQGVVQVRDDIRVFGQSQLLVRIVPDRAGGEVRVVVEIGGKPCLPALPGDRRAGVGWGRLGGLGDRRGGRNR